MRCETRNLFLRPPVHHPMDLAEPSSSLLSGVREGVKTLLLLRGRWDGREMVPSSSSPFSAFVLSCWKLEVYGIPKIRTRELVFILFGSLRGSLGQMTRNFEIPNVKIVKRSDFQILRTRSRYNSTGNLIKSSLVVSPKGQSQIVHCLLPSSLTPWAPVSPPAPAPEAVYLFSPKFSLPHSLFL